MENGMFPFFVSTTLGTTGCVAFDNLDEIGETKKMLKRLVKSFRKTNANDFFDFLSSNGKDCMHTTSMTSRPFFNFNDLDHIILSIIYSIISL
jgi:hypothetical protein